MAPSKLQKAIWRVKDRTRISLAKVGGSTSLADLDVAIVKATRHEEQPADERYFREIIYITSYSRAYIFACVNTLSKRLNKTKSWTVALKSLMLIQKLLAEGDPEFQQEFFFSTRRGTRILNLSDFRDASQHQSWDFSAFVRTYALYLDERLEYNIQDRRWEKPKKNTLAQDAEQEEESVDKENVVKTYSYFREMKTEEIFATLSHLQQLLGRFLACRPTGAAKCHSVVTAALYQMVKESFQLYYDITELQAIFIERFMELDLAESLNVYDLFCRQGKQLDELDNFYSWCKTAGIGQSTEYPDIEKITLKKLGFIDEIMRDKKSAVQQINDGFPKYNAKEEVKEPKAVEEDVNAIKALPAPEVKEQAAPVEKEPEKEKEYKTEKSTLILFEAGAPVRPPPVPGWEAFPDETDCELPLVQTSSNLNHQKANPGGGLDALTLDGMYQQVQTRKDMASRGLAVTRSASSIMLGSAGRPAALALPAAPQNGN
ncbi:Phosphatidylinositol binding clathrin assembly protein 5a [Hibiscus trionum]|uniref:Phosphatidylinositol binding clathrin assembly protein 5a n=1 Tax=Hibiscus trionum TaxID=183268 RepID=A0A9W7HXL8_HIBTR|nr:Phosphatidylinositol binding clathrin assembly protein 5a [Hibiscus trionum]